jgi:hypothetical protein
LPRLDQSNQMEGIEIIGSYIEDRPCQLLRLTKLPALVGGSGSLDRLWQCQGNFHHLQSLSATIVNSKFAPGVAVKSQKQSAPDRYWQIWQELERDILALRKERNRKN